MASKRPKCNIVGCNRWARKKHYKTQNSSLPKFFKTCSIHGVDGAVLPCSDKRRRLAYMLKCRNSITLEEYEQKLRKQNYCCVVCGRQQAEFINRLAVDHNHKTGQIRGLLCCHCNQLVGNLETEADLILKVQDYLKFWSNE